ncbi:MAG: NAD(P)H-dependent oxidoreductase subunit E [bacterium]
MLRETTTTAIEALFARYPLRRGALIPALHIAQSEKGFLEREDFVEVGDLFNLDPAEVESVASFYTMFYSKPQGKCVFQLCTNISCMLEGAYDVMTHIEHQLGIRKGQVTEDGLFGLMEVECLAACGHGPCLQISDREYYQRVTPGEIDTIIQHFRQGGTHPAPGAETDPVIEFVEKPAYLPLENVTPKPRPVPPPPPPPAGAPAPVAAPAVTVTVAPPKPAAPKPPPRAPGAPPAVPNFAKPVDLDAITAQAQEDAQKRLAAAAKRREEETRHEEQLEAQRQEKLKQERAAIDEKRRVIAQAKLAAALGQEMSHRLVEQQKAPLLPAPPRPMQHEVDEAREAADVEAIEPATPRIADLYPRGVVKPETGGKRVLVPGMTIGNAAPKMETAPPVTPSQSPAFAEPVNEGLANLVSNLYGSAEPQTSPAEQTPDTGIPTPSSPIQAPDQPETPPTPPAPPTPPTPPAAPQIPMAPPPAAPEPAGPVVTEPIPAIPQPGPAIPTPSGPVEAPDQPPKLARDRASDLNLGTAEGLPEWIPSNPMLRYLKGGGDSKEAE